MLRTCYRTGPKLKSADPRNPTFDMNLNVWIGVLVSFYTVHMLFLAPVYLSLTPILALLQLLHAPNGDSETIASDMHNLLSQEYRKLFLSHPKEPRQDVPPPPRAEMSLEKDRCEVEVLGHAQRSFMTTRMAERYK